MASAMGGWMTTLGASVWSLMRGFPSERAGYICFTTDRCSPEPPDQACGAGAARLRSWKNFQIVRLARAAKKHQTEMKLS